MLFWFLSVISKCSAPLPIDFRSVARLNDGLLVKRRKFPPVLIRSARRRMFIHGHSCLQGQKGACPSILCYLNLVRWRVPVRLFCAVLPMNGKYLLVKSEVLSIINVRRVPVRPYFFLFPSPSASEDANLSSFSGHQLLQ